MSEVWSEILKRYGTTAVIFAVVGGLAIWILAHWAAAPGSEVSVLWGLVKYTKQPYEKTISKESQQTLSPTPSLELTAEKSLDKNFLPPVILTVRHDVPKNDVNKILTDLRSQRQLRELTATESGKPTEEIPAGTYFFVFGGSLRSDYTFKQNKRIPDFIGYFNHVSASRYPRHEASAEVHYVEGKERNVILFLNEQTASQITQLSGETQHQVMAAIYPWGNMTSLVSVPVDRIRESRVRDVELSKRDEAIMLDLLIQ